LALRGDDAELFLAHLERRQRLPDHGQFRVQERAGGDRKAVAVFFVRARITHPAQQPVERQLAALRFHRPRPCRLAAAASPTACSWPPPTSSAPDTDAHVLIIIKPDG
jgi:hypothetical protein